MKRVGQFFVKSGTTLEWDDSLVKRAEQLLVKRVGQLLVKGAGQLFSEESWTTL